MGEVRTYIARRHENTHQQIDRQDKQTDKQIRLQRGGLVIMRMVKDQCAGAALQMLGFN